MRRDNLCATDYPRNFSGGSDSIWPRDPRYKAAMAEAIRQFKAGIESRRPPKSAGRKTAQPGERR